MSDSRTLFEKGYSYEELYDVLNDVGYVLTEEKGTTLRRLLEKGVIKKGDDGFIDGTFIVLIKWVDKS
jgi:hypothetical protein